MVLCKKTVLIVIGLSFISSFNCAASFEQCVQASQDLLQAKKHESYQQASRKLAVMLKECMQSGGDINKFISVQKFVEALCSNHRMQQLFSELQYDAKTMYSLLMLFVFTGYPSEVNSCMDAKALILQKATNGLTALDIAIVKLAIEHCQNRYDGKAYECLQELLAFVSNRKKSELCVQSLQTLRSNSLLVASITNGYKIDDVMACLDSSFERKLIAHFLS